MKRGADAVKWLRDLAAWMERDCILPEDVVVVLGGDPPQVFEIGCQVDHSWPGTIMPFGLKRAALALNAEEEHRRDPQYATVAAAWGQRKAHMAHRNDLQVAEKMRTKWTCESCSWREFASERGALMHQRLAKRKDAARGHDNGNHSPLFVPGENVETLADVMAGLAE